MRGNVAAVVVVGALLAACGGGQKKALSACEGKLFVCHADLDKSETRGGQCAAELAGVSRAETLVQARIDDLTRLWTGLAPAATELRAVWSIRKGYLVAEIPGDALFERGGAALVAAGGEGLARFAAALSDIGDREIIVVGHADDASPGKKKKGDNWDLSMARALSVVRKLGESGVPRSRLTAAGVGERGSLANGDATAGMRVELIIGPTDDEISTINVGL